jgi:sec-independent protein translocase protein TatC
MTATQSRQGVSGSDYVGEEMTLAEHLRELRERLMKSIVAIAVGFVVGFVFHGTVLELLRRPYCALPPELRGVAVAVSPNECSLFVLRVFDGFLISVKAAAIIAVVVAAPAVSYQVWRFVTPGLRPVERRYAIPFLVASQLLFAGGAVFSFFLLPRALEFLLGFAGRGIVPLLDANQYITFILHTMIAFGVAFEFPLILIMLALMGVVTAGGLRRYRRHALFGTFVAAAIITPTQDPVTMTLMAAPLVVFYEVTVAATMLIEHRRARAAAASPA